MNFYKLKAVITEIYGSIDTLKLSDEPIPSLKHGEVLINVKACSINPIDWKILRGNLKILFGKKPPKILGSDFCGKIVKIGENSNYKIGDEVWGLLQIRNLGKNHGTNAEYIVCDEKIIDYKPKNLTFEESASFPLACLTSFQALIHQAKIKKKQNILINGCSGGVGIFAIQIAKYYDCTITGICSEKNRIFSKQLGCDNIIDYQKEDILKNDNNYDIWFDVIGNYSFPLIKHQLSSKGFYINSMPTREALINTSWHSLFNIFRNKKAQVVMVKPSKKDLLEIRSLVEKNILKTKVDKIYKLNEYVDAYKYSQSQRAQGKLVIKVS